LSIATLVQTFDLGRPTRQLSLVEPLGLREVVSREAS
jgi:hypothetical protein